MVCAPFLFMTQNFIVACRFKTIFDRIYAVARVCPSERSEARTQSKNPER